MAKRAQQKFLIIGNWKMNPDTLDEAKALFTRIAKAAKGNPAVEAVIAAPYPFIAPLAQKKAAGVALAAQDVSVEERGAHTGQVSATQIASTGAEYSIIGHSERRAAGETGEVVSAKVRRAIDAGLSAILCVGENSRDDQAQYLSFVREQLFAVFGKLDRASARKIIVAYEPVWQVGASFNLKIAPRDIHEMAIFIKKTVAEFAGKEIGMKTRVLYGGSTHPDNVSGILHDGGVDGLLVGRNSLDAEAFKKIFEATRMDHGDHA
jgi:triosephosphate isomerase